VIIPRKTFFYYCNTLFEAKNKQIPSRLNFCLDSGHDCPKSGLSAEIWRPGRLITCRKNSNKKMSFVRFIESCPNKDLFTDNSTKTAKESYKIISYQFIILSNYYSFNCFISDNSIKCTHCKNVIIKQRNLWLNS
jgi:hypothetical protein